MRLKCASLPPLHHRSMQSSVRIVECLLRVRSVTFHFSTSTFLRELHPAQTVATPTEVMHGQYTMWQDSNVLQFFTNWLSPTSVILRQCESMTSFKRGHPFPKAARPVSPTFCKSRWGISVSSTAQQMKTLQIIDQLTLYMVSVRIWLHKKRFEIEMAFSHYSTGWVLHYIPGRH